MKDKIDNLIFKALSLVNEDKNQEVKDLIYSILNNKSYLNILDIVHWQFIADISLAVGNFELAKDAYIKANNQSGTAFTLILENKLNDAKNILLKCNDSPAKLWCNFLIELFSQKKLLKNWPPFLIIRHFLELTVYYLLLANNFKFIQIILNNLDKLLETNLESQKFVGYAYFHFGLVDKAIEILRDSLKQNQFDGEVYFVLGQAYLKKTFLYEALAMLENAHLFLPHHYPTIELLEKLKAETEQRLL